MHFVPSMLRAFLSEPGLERCRSLKRVICSGEALTKELQERFHARMRAELHNLYGPTEAAIDVTFWPCERGDERASIPIGRPVANTQIYITDGDLRPVPVGVAGELHIGGVQLARGYLSRPELTAERFIPDPFSAEPGARLYKTGDLARYLEGGEIEFVGRLDHQVKLRGFRVELGEIEAALVEHASVSECVVAAREDVPGDPYLVAYVVPPTGAAGGAVAAGRVLREFLKEKLPEHMLPSAFVVLEALPVTPNGKLDRRALPAPAPTRDAGAEARASARDPLEELVAGVWADVLGLAEVGREENFFELGGHSLRALRVVARLRTALRVEVPVRELFEAPTVVGIAARIEELRRGGLSLSSAPLRPDRTDGERPLSFAQQRLWFLDQLEPGDDAYNIAAAVRLEGALDTEELERSFGEVVRRHEALRASFISERGEPRQVIAPTLHVPLRVEDLRAAPSAGEREAEVERISREEAVRVFDLSEGPLLRTTLLKLGDEEHVLLLTMHHIVSDGWSMGVLVREVAALYEAFTEGRESPLAELPVQYADFARWQRQTLSGEALERQLTYWKQRLGGLTTMLELPTKQGRASRPVGRRRSSAALLFDLPAPLAQSLKSLSRRAGATLYMTLLAAFQTLLHRYTNQEDITVGSPVAGRGPVETEGLIGFFVNTLVMRTDLAGDPTFEELLGRVRETCLGAYAHQDVPFERVVEELQPERSLSHSPLFQVMFVLQNAPTAPLEVPGLKLTPVISDGGEAKFDLTLAAEETERGVACRLVYDADLFDHVAVARMASHFEELLKGLAADPSLRLSELPLLAEGESRRLLVEWNDTRRDVPGGDAATLHELFERRAAATPDATAVAFEGERVSYRELNRRADALARRLRDAGVGAGSLVGVCAGRSVELIVAVLGVLKAGGAYVPLDPEYPRERLAFMAEDARVKVLLTQKRHDGLLDGLSGQEFETLYLDDARAEGAAANVSTNNKANVSAQDAAYVIYTSGSTGRPKGVVVSHRAVVNALAAHRAFQREPVASTLLQISHAFDASLLNIFCTLSQGGTLFVPRGGWQADPAHVARLIAEEGITALFNTPSAYALLLEEARPEQLETLRTVYVGGEICPPRLIEKHRALAPHAALFNEYGPTEATIWCLVHDCRATTEGAPVPIGRPGANMRVYVLDGRLRPVPVGVAGELYVGGCGLARGYLNRSALTAAAFIPDPFASEPGARLYRTGDVVRWLEAGEVEYVGRNDEQVKIRGFRVEPGEIEAALTRHARVREAVVQAQRAKSDAPSVQSLTAYYTVTDGESVPSADELRSHLQAHLPGHMIPSAFVFLEALPLTPNGKLDRRALPEPERVVAAASVPPRTSTEKALADIWCEVLGLAEVGAFDGFFELGGHSLLATQVVARAREAFEVELPLRAIFEAPTVAGLAERVEAALALARGRLRPPILPVGREGELPLSFAQQRLWFLDQLEPGNPFYNIPGALRLTGALDPAALGESINEVVRRHEALRTTFESVQGQPRQIIAPELRLELPLVELRSTAETERGDEVMRLAAEEAQRPFDLAHGPLARARLLRTGEREHVLLFTVHHIVSDGWSMGVLFREVAESYQAFSEGARPALAELPIQYADFAVWQREWLRGAALDEQLDYWRGQLGGLPPLLKLPTDAPRPRLQTYHGATERFALPPEVVAELRRLARGEGVTLFMLLLAAFDVLLSRYTSQEDIAVGTPIANRTRPETEPLIGFFANTLALRTDLSGDPTFRELVARVREVCLGAYAHQDVPFEKLVEELQPERDLSHSPLFQVMFALQEGAGETLLPRGLEMRPLAVESGVAKFDLTLALSETGEGMSCALEYNTDLFGAATAHRMIGHWRRLLRGIAADPGARVSELPLLTDEERDQLIVGWNEWDGARVDGECVHELFERRAEERPDAVAAVCGEEELTYAELNRRANQLAHHLRRRGVRAETLVGVLLERSAEMLVGVLGVLKAGGAYVPLDPEYPRERLAHVLGDARAPLVVTRARFAGLVAGHNARAVLLDAEAEEMARESAENPRADVTADNLAYVVYTSGSTGTPKGVCVRHASLVNHNRAVSERYCLRSADRVLQFASVSFDVAAEELFASWSCGASVVLMPADDYSLATFTNVIERKRVSVVSLPASYWHGWVAELERSRAELPPSLRLAVVGNEAVSAAHFAAWREAARGRVGWMNAYGPTEATITATLFEPADDAELRARDSVPIGRPVRNVTAYVLDVALNPVPVGVVGELHLGGACLARGYLNRLGQTAEKFIPDPFSAGPGARLYKTGDLARLLPDGHLDFVGRNDEQVKIRGFRVEPGEIEAALAGHEAVRACAVVAREDAPGDKRLVAYVVAGEEDAEGRERRIELWPSVGEYQVYDELLYSAMTYDEARNEKYRAAIDRLVRDKVVVEIGTGKDAILARFCAEAGARKVYAIETLEESYNSAKALVTRLGLAGRIKVIHGDSFGVRLPERADVCVSEIIGTIGSSEGTVPVLNDARRFLTEDGINIPQRCLTKIAAVELPDENMRAPRLEGLPGSYAEKVFEHVGHRFDVRLCLKNFSEEILISDAGLFEDLDFTGHVNLSSEREVTLTVRRDARLDGLLLWINLHTCEGAVIDTLAGDYSWLPVFFPAFGSGLEVRAGDRIKAVCSAAPSDNGVNPDYRVKGRLLRSNGEAIEFDFQSFHHEPVYKQTEFYCRLFAQDGAAAAAVNMDGRARASAKDLRAYLAARLPEYMVPSAFVRLAELPLTPSGKVDRRALPAPECADAESSESFVAPRGPVEELLAGIFAEVLGLAQVGVGEDFFELGGHSLLATQVVARVREAFDVELPVRQLFESRTVAAVAAWIEAARGAGLTTEAARPRRAPRDGELPLSFVQQRFWFLDQLMPGSAAYNIPTAVRLRGALDADALERSFDEVVRRHEVLRTTFAADGGRPRQVIADELKLRLTHVDLSAHPDDEREAEARRLALGEAREPFDLARGPLLRAKLLRHSEDEHVLLFTMHHIVSDGWSAGVLVRELTTIYEAFTEGRESPLAELPIQYVDFAVWQREWLRGEVLERRLEYWRKQFAGRLPVLDLPTDRPRPPVPTDRGAVRHLALPAGLAEEARALSRGESVTLFMLLLAVFNVLLHKYSRQEDILVGSSIANRNHVETEGLIGLLINTLVLRTDLSGDPTFRELLARVREVSLGAYAHQDMPLEQILDELRPEWDASRAPVFQVAFQLQNFRLPSVELKGLTLSPLTGDVGTAKFDLSMTLVETPEGLSASLEYSTDLFEAETIERMLGHYRTLLEAVVADPRARLSDLSLLSDAERRQLLSEWNPTDERRAPAALLHRAFEEQARRTPHSIALVYEGRRMSYAELNERANKLARHLRSLGVGPESLVALCVERSAEMVVAVLAVVKAGGAYVPIDPNYPAERAAFILEDTRAGILLTQQTLLRSLPAHRGQVVLLDEDWPQVDEESAQDLDDGAAADNAAYVIYTSGSTGRPKGVVVTHENVARLFEAAQPLFNFDARDVWTLFHSYAFDFSVWELWGALLYGGRLVVVPYWASRSAEAFRRLLSDEQVTVLNQTPSAFRQLIRADEESGGELHLRLVIFGGEALELRSLAPWFARRGDERPALVNMYGITETTVHVTYRPVVAADLDAAAGGGSPIGQPLSSLQVHLLDERGRLVPVGVPGEVYVGGAGLARGYLSRPALTAAAFVPDPFSAEPGARLYRSGDLAWRLPDGQLEYLGRVDHQVKIRGFRIETGEVEAALAGHGAVRECVVVAGEDAAGDKRLVAYVVVAGAAPAAGELREFLHTKLPEHMIPALFVELEALPLTAHGKVDRRALPAPDQSRPHLSKEFVAPRTPVERELARIWRELLGVEEVGVTDDFFELGGHSLLLTQLASWVRKSFQVEVPLRALFDTPTIAEMTKAILARQARQQPKDDLARMLGQVKQLSPSEVRAMLEKMGERG
nr:AMP-dependent synthetase and ligase [uncultured bacterium]